VPQLPAQLLARGLQLPALAPHAAWPGILPEGVNHGAPDAAFGERLELDASRLIEAVGGIDQPDDPVLDEVADVDRMGHRRGDATGELLDERYACDDSRILSASLLGAAHDFLRRPTNATAVPNCRAFGITASTC